MAIIYERNKVIAVASEPSYGAEPSPTPFGNQAVETRGDLQITPYDGPRVQHVVDRGYAGAFKEINVNPSVALAFSVGMQGSGTLGTAPAYNALLKACALTETVMSPLSGGVRYNLTALSSAGSCYVKRWKGSGATAIRQVIPGVRGNLQGTIQRGQLPFFTFAMRGQYNTPGTQTVTPDISDYIVPIPVTQTNTPTLSVNGYTGARLESFTFDLGNVLAHHNTTNVNEIFISDRGVRGQISLVAEDLATHNYFTNLESHSAVTTTAFQLIHGTVAGKKVQFDMPAVQLSNLSEANAVDGVSMWTFDWIAVPTSAQNEFVLTFK